MTNRTGTLTAKLTASLVLLLALAGCTPAASPVLDSSPAAPAEVAEQSGPILGLLDTIPVKGKAPKTGYDRQGMFGTAWVDVDWNGCDTRNDILARDLTDKVFDGPCKVLTGSFDEPYTGERVDFVRGNTTSTLVQIDHVVALMNAWETGAQQMSQEARVEFANDPLKLLAVDGPSNSAKGAGDAATWLPANKGFRCEYVGLQVQVKAKYGLWVTQAERDAIVRVLDGCAPSAAPVEQSPAVEQPAEELAAEVAPAADETVEVPAPVQNIRPGSFCSPQGATGTADNGRTYTCGGNGPGAGGRFHWNA